MRRSATRFDLVALIALVLALLSLIAAARADAQAYCCILGDNGNGITEDTARLDTCPEPVPVRSVSWSEVKAQHDR